jgi:phosphoglycerate kinase
MTPAAPDGAATPDRPAVPFRTIDDLAADRAAGAFGNGAPTLLVRLDLNAPIEDGRVADTQRFARYAGTVAELVADGYRVVCLAHQGRPGRDTYVSLDGHADRLAERAGVNVDFVADTHGDAALAAIDGLEPGGVLLLENVRFADAELADRSPAEHAESDLVRSLAATADAYVNDAFSAAHRAHASLVGFPQVLPAYGGRVMAAEYAYNTSARERDFDGEVAMVLGGVKADDLVDVMGAVDDRVDTFCCGGVLGELVLRDAGHDVGYDVETDDGTTDLFDDQWDALGDTIGTLNDRYGRRLHAPVDLAYADESGGRAEVRAGDAAKAEEGPYLDVGGLTSDAYRPIIERSAAVFVKGALGVFEDERFGDGTRRLLETVADSDCYSVVGGGDTARALDLYDIDPDAFDHVSIAGGAYVAALAGRSLPAVEALVDAA